jgi:hypothetical protein
MARIRASDLPPGLVPGLPGRSKYRATATTYNGVRYASRAEADYARTLDESGQVAWWIGQPRFRLGCPENRYSPDFLVALTLGGIIAVDVKGFETPKSRYGPIPLHIVRKGSCVEVIHPEDLT